MELFQLLQKCVSAPKRQQKCGLLISKDWNGEMRVARLSLTQNKIPGENYEIKHVSLLSLPQSANLFCRVCLDHHLCEAQKKEPRVLEGGKNGGRKYLLQIWYLDAICIAVSPWHFLKERFHLNKHIGRQRKEKIVWRERGKGLKNFLNVLGPQFCDNERGPR